MFEIVRIKIKRFQHWGLSRQVKTDTWDLTAGGRLGHSTSLLVPPICQHTNNHSSTLGCAPAQLNLSAILFPSVLATVRETASSLCLIFLGALKITLLALFHLLHPSFSILFQIPSVSGSQ